MEASSAIEFLIWLLIAASLIAVVATRLRIPYTVALVLGGLALGSVHLPILDTLINQRPDWLAPNVVLVVFLPPLLFEGSLKMQVRQLRETLVPIMLLTTLGVLAATLITGFALHWLEGIPVLAALVFGAIVSATDPISVLAIFRDAAVSKRLTVIVEGESLFNDGTAAVLFGILVAATATGNLHVRGGLQEFLVVVLGGAAVGLGLGFMFSKIVERIDEPQIEITLTTILAYGSYLGAQSLHFSGVIATVTAGLMLGNFGARIGMSPRTRVALWSFWEYMSFVINSIVFLLIGLQVRMGSLLQAWKPTLLAIGMVLLGRMLSVYALTPIGNRMSEAIPLRWQHVLVWGGLRGALSLALALSLSSSFPYRAQILVMTFGVVAFTIVVQGLTIKPLLRALRIATSQEDAYALAKVQKIAILSARSELDTLFRNVHLSRQVYERLRRELDSRLERADQNLTELYSKDESLMGEEMRTARLLLIAAEKTSIAQALHEGLISPQTAAKMASVADRQADELREGGEKSPEASSETSP